jgi:hypothetical protein
MKKMIDCNITANYFAEKERLCASILECIDCPLRHGNDCTNIENKYPKRAISIVQKWSDKHPQKTYLTELLENYPNAELDHGVPKVCLKKLGVVSGCAKTKKSDLYISCYRCWNQPIEEGEE